MKSEHFSKGLSEGLEYDPNHPSIIEELLQQEHEWTNIQDVIKLSFKAVHQVLYHHVQLIGEIQQVLPQKANKSDVHQQLGSKANLIDIKKTMAEVAANIESRISYEDAKRLVEDRVSKQELQYQLQNKVSYDDIKHIMEQMNQQNPHHQELLEDEIARIKKQLEDTYKEVQKKMSQNLGSSKDIQQLSMSIEQRFQDFEEKLNEKANKQSVAQALHRKANRPEIDAVIAKKADLSDLQRVIAALENKIDVTSFETLVRAVENKADRHEIHQIPQSFRNMEPSSDIDKALQHFSTEKYEIEKRLNDLERQLQLLSRDQALSMDSVKSLINISLSQKVDFKDLDGITHQVHSKVDVEKVQELVSALRQEIVTQLTQIKKDVNIKTKRKDEDQKKNKQESQFANEKALEEIKNIKDKMSKLAAQFDKELADRDKLIKGNTGNLQTEIQRVVGSIQTELESIRKIVNDIELRKAEKREIVDFKTKVQNQIDNKPEISEIQSLITNLTSDQTQKNFDLRTDLFKKITEIQNLVQQTMAKKIGVEEFNEVLSQKADLSTLRSSLEQKVNVSELDSQKRYLDKLLKDMDSKVSLKDLESFMNFAKNTFEDLNKELLLRASIKDVCTLMDTKANVEDVNHTLALVQKEVEKCVVEDDLRKALNEQALVNEALCAQNCVGRWIWKSGELKNSNLVPWEVQALNTCPDNFLWEKNKTSVVAVAPGLYEVSFGFYSKKQPTVQIHLNGEPLMSVQKSQYVTDHGKENRVANVGKHSAGNVTGLTMLDFIAIPARARLSITFACEAHGEGFFNIRKL